jgi:uncharacterized protein YidB (DUF937 family)
MTIQAVGSQDYGAQMQTAGARRPLGPPPADTFSSTAKLLGTSTDDLKSQLDSGETLDSIASAKGVGSDDLLAAVTADLKAHKPPGAPELSDDQLTQMATNIAAGKGPRGGGGGPHRTPGTSASDPTQALQSLADTLGTTTDDLLQQLQDGSDLSSLFGQSGSATWGSQGSASSGLAVDLYA